MSAKTVRVKLDATDLQRLLNWHERWYLTTGAPAEVLTENLELRLRIRALLGELEPELGPGPKRWPAEGAA